jgi:hypothetical protein
VLGRAWYADKHARVHTHTYSSRTAATDDARKAAEHGWQVNAEEESEAPFQDRNWATGGPVGTFLTGMREPGEREIVVTYVRTAEWLTANGSK